MTRWRTSVGMACSIVGTSGSSNRTADGRGRRQEAGRVGGFRLLLPPAPAACLLPSDILSPTFHWKLQPLAAYVRTSSGNWLCCAGSRVSRLNEIPPQLLEE